MGNFSFLLKLYKICVWEFLKSGMVQHTDMEIIVMKEGVCTRRGSGAGEGWAHGLSFDGSLCEGMSKVG